MTAYLGPEFLSVLINEERECIHTALVEAARRDSLTPVDLLRDKRWILAAKVKRQEAVDEEELGWIIVSLKERATISERNGMILNPLFDQLLAEKVEFIKEKREQEMLNKIKDRYKEKTACS